MATGSVGKVLTKSKLVAEDKVRLWWFHSLRWSLIHLLAMFARMEPLLDRVIQPSL